MSIPQKSLVYAYWPVPIPRENPYYHFPMYPFKDIFYTQTTLPSTTTILKTQTDIIYSVLHLDFFT